MPTPFRATRRLAPLAALALALAAPTPDALAQSAPVGLRAELIADVEGLEQKYVGLADALQGKYGWRPAEGVRSVGEVFSHVAAANYMIPTFAGATVPEHLRGADQAATRAKLQAVASETDDARIRESLRASFAHVKQAIASVPDDQLDVQTKMFGRDATRRQVLTLLVTHMHEHLGQQIAYARGNGVVPPWSAN